MKIRTIRYCVLLSGFIVWILFVFTSNMVFAKPNSLSIQENEVRGRVTDAQTGEALPGVSVYLEGTTFGTVTNADGNYSLRIEDPNSVIVFSFLGFITETIEYEGQLILNVSLVPDITLMDEAVVVGFSKQRRINVTGSIHTINPALLETSSSSLSNSFAGRLSGVTAVQRSGEPGSNNSEFWIRGISTFGANNTPLVFVDGVEIHSGGDLNSIDPAIIENFTVLKDASSTSLYGARGANGVILITTKSGIVSDRPIVNVKMHTTTSQPTALPGFTDAVTYMQMANEAVQNSNPNAPEKYSQQQILGTQNGLDPYLFPNVNWMNELFRRNALNQHVNVNIRGGSPKVQYFSSVSYNNSTGLINKTEGNDTGMSFNRLNIQNNLNSNLSPTTRLQVNVNTNFELKEAPNISAEELFQSVMFANPVQFPKTFPSEDSHHIRFGAKPGGYWGVFPNPYARLQSGKSKVKTSTLLALARLTQDIPFVEGLTAEVMVSVKNWSLAETRQWYDPFFYRVEPATIVETLPGVYDYDVNLIGEGGNKSLRFGNYNGGNNFIQFQPQLNYARIFGKHDLQALIVYSQREFTISDPGNFLLSLPFRNQGVSTRLSYVYNLKYMLETNIGYTGSENFARNRRFGLFPSLSAGYAISNEDFFKSVFGDYVSLLKIRASYGITGNDQVGYGRFPYLSDVNLYESSLGYHFGYDFKNYRDGVLIRSFGNNHVTWETSKKTNIGVDLELLSGLSLNADYFEEYRSGILMQRSLIPSYIGIGNANPYANIGEVKNRGIDASFNFNRAFSPDLIIQSMGTFTFARNTILAIDEPPGFAEMYPNLTRVGRPVGQIYALRAGNIFSSQEELDFNPEQRFGNYTVGDIRYLNVNNDGVVDVNDRVPMGYPTVPEITYGLGASVKYKKVDFSFFFQGVARTSFMLSNIHPFTTEFERNVLSFIAEDYWSLEGNNNPFAAYPRITEEFNQNNNVASSWWLRNGAFLRLKDVEIGYKINRFIRIYVMGQNLLTFSGFDLWDPEIASPNGLRYPTQKSFTLGLNCTF
jgi:TonB-linked SusC/RagA family outer membrane protein